MRSPQPHHLVWKTFWFAGVKQQQTTKILNIITFVLETSGHASFHCRVESFKILLLVLFFVNELWVSRG